MTPASPVLVALLLLALRVGNSQEPAAADPWITRPAPRVIEAASYADPAGRFTLDYPKKDWRIVPAGYASLVTLTHKNTEATIILERQELVRPLSPAAVGDLFVQLQVDEIRKLDPLAQEVTRKIIATPSVRVPVFEYVRRVSERETDHVRMYLLPHGSFLYRLVCRSATDKLPKHAAAFALVASSLRFKEPN